MKLDLAFDMDDSWCNLFGVARHGRHYALFVIAANAGIHLAAHRAMGSEMDSRIRGNDVGERGATAPD
jgi:hypothetical protein